MFYHYLLTSGCTPIGKFSEIVYMRCGNRSAYFRSFIFYDYYYYVRGIKILEDEFKKIEKLRSFTEEEIKLLYGRLTVISVDFSHFIGFGLFETEPIYLLKRGGIGLFLANVDITFSPDYPNTSLINILIDATTPTNEIQWFMAMHYFVKGDGTLEPGVVDFSSFAVNTFRGGKIREEDVLRALGEKYLTIDGLLRDTEEVVRNGIKALVTVLLY